MIRVERMSLHLPAQLAPHAHAIVNRIGEVLAAAETTVSHPVESISVPPIAIDPVHGPMHAADAIATAVRDAVDRSSRA